MTTDGPVVLKRTAAKGMIHCGDESTTAEGKLPAGMDWQQSNPHSAELIEPRGKKPCQTQANQAKGSAAEWEEEGSSNLQDQPTV